MWDKGWECNHNSFFFFFLLICLLALDGGWSARLSESPSVDPDIKEVKGSQRKGGSEGGPGLWNLSSTNVSSDQPATAALLFVLLLIWHLNHNFLLKTVAGKRKEAGMSLVVEDICQFCVFTNMHRYKYDIVDFYTWMKCSNDCVQYVRVSLKHVIFEYFKMWSKM